MRLTAYLNFSGRCAEAFRVYQQVFGGELSMMTHGDSPMADQVGPEWRDAVMHALLKGDDWELMGSDAPPAYFEKPQGFGVAIQIPAADAERVYAALSEGGEIRMPLQQTFWASAFAMFSDRFGTPWMISSNDAPTAS
jgi:PhnB protein